MLNRKVVAFTLLCFHLFLFFFKLLTFPLFFIKHLTELIRYFIFIEEIFFSFFKGNIIFIFRFDIVKGFLNILKGS